ncbi:MAG: creatininase family protein [Terriglobia bacterium]
MSKSASKYLYSDLTWPEINEAVELQKVILLPVGSTEQHGHHLPLEVDNLIATNVCLEAGRRIPEKVLVAPTIPYGYNLNAMDFPGTIHVSYDHFVEYCADVCKSLAYHGFKRIIIVNGHGGNTALLEVVCRKVVMETDALTASFMWWNMLQLDPGFVKSFRESTFPGGSGHACEIETSMVLGLAGEKVQMEKAKDHIAWYNQKGATGFQWGDAFGSGPVTFVEWTSTFVEEGVFGQPTLATAEKGNRILNEAASRLVQFIGEFQTRVPRPRVDHHSARPTSPPPKV